MHVHVNELFNVNYIIQNRGENNNNVKSNLLENVLTHHKLIVYVATYLPSLVSGPSKISSLVTSLLSIYQFE